LSVPEEATKMSQRWWEDDDQLLAALREAFRSARSVPAEFTATATATLVLSLGIVALENRFLLARAVASRAGRRARGTTRPGIRTSRRGQGDSR
ncbi:MAG TPA: hypothetical protein VMK84_14890, partial [Streptosporangiaceae bacterium]|nr:hypothetical protein [Streptosporangiaceae bacterium]